MSDAERTDQNRDEFAERGSASRSIARMQDGHALTPRQMDERGLIHRSERPRPEVDAFRELRTRLLSVSEGNFITLVVPVARGSGGSFVARNLAAALAFDEARSALLIDCDLRQPCQQQAIGVNAERGGLVELLESSEAHISDALYPTGIPRLRLLPAGASRESGSEYFGSVRMRLLLDSLRSRYPDRFIVLDGPPALGSPDSRILAEHADAILLVAGYGRDTPARIAQAAGNFDPGKFAGVVFNQGP